MNCKKRLFKPRWQHKDAALRAQAVASEQDPDLLASLAGANDQNPPDPDRASPPAKVLPEEGGGLSGGAFVLIALTLPLTVVAGRFVYRRWRPRSDDL